MNVSVNATLTNRSLGLHKTPTYNTAIHPQNVSIRTQKGLFREFLKC